MIRDPAGKTMDRHHRIQTESNPGRYTPMRTCTGPCRKRKSITQFAAASALCIQCVRRAPKPEGVAA